MRHIIFPLYPNCALRRFTFLFVCCCCFCGGGSGFGFDCSAARHPPAASHSSCSFSYTINPILFIVLILLLAPKGTLCLKHIKDKNRDILNESVDGGNVNSIGLGIVMNNGGNIERFLTDKDLLASYYLKASTQLKCCEEQVRNWSANKKMGEIQLIGCGMKIESTLSKVNLESFQFLSLFQHEENYFKSKTDIYDSKFDLGQLSLADLSQTSSNESAGHDYTNFKSATQFALFFQPLFAICWFIAVLALENIHSYVFPTIFAICFNILVSNCVASFFSASQHRKKNLRMYTNGFLISLHFQF